MPSVTIVLLSVGLWEGIGGGREWNLCGLGIFCLSQSQDTTINEKKILSQCNSDLTLERGHVITLL